MFTDGQIRGEKAYNRSGEIVKRTRASLYIERVTLEHVSPLVSTVESITKSSTKFLEGRDGLEFEAVQPFAISGDVLAKVGLKDKKNEEVFQSVWEGARQYRDLQLENEAARRFVQE